MNIIRALHDAAASRRGKAHARMLQARPPRLPNIQIRLLSPITIFILYDWLLLYLCFVFQTNMRGSTFAHIRTSLHTRIRRDPVREACRLRAKSKKSILVHRYAFFWGTKESVCKAKLSFPSINFHKYIIYEVWKRIIFRGGVEVIIMDTTVFK